MNASRILIICIIDCAPSLGLLTLNALAAAQEVLIPLQPHFLALQGFGKLLQTVELVNRRINPGLKVNGILLCMFDSRASLPNEVKADIERFLNDARGTNSAWAEAHVLPVLVRRNIKLAEAPSYGQTIFEYENTCHGAEDYQKVADFINAQSYQPAQDTEVQAIDEQTEPENSTDYSNQEQSEYSETQEDNFQSQEQLSEENDLMQSEPQAEYSIEIQEYSPENIENHEIENQQASQEPETIQTENQPNLNQNDSEPEYIDLIQELSSEIQENVENQNPPQVDISPDYIIQGEPEYETSSETTEQNEYQNEQQSQEDVQSFDGTEESSFVNDNATLNEKPPIEIREIQSYGSYQGEQRTHPPEESDQPEQINNPEQEHQGT